MSIQQPPIFGGSNPQQPPTPEQQGVAFVQAAMESCPFKSVSSGVIGFGLGGFIGLFMTSLDWQSSLSDEFQKMKLKDQLKFTAKDVGQKCWSSAKNFAVIGAIFSGTECVIESYRAKNDMYNGIGAGCITGGALAAKAGPRATVWGCAGFAAFSGAMDYFLREHF